MAEMVEIVSCERGIPLIDYERINREWAPLSKGVFHIFTANMPGVVLAEVVSAFTGRYVPDGQRVEIGICSRPREKLLQFTWLVTGEYFYSYTAVQFFPTLERLVEKYNDYISHYPHQP